jgi:hypothetical protein
MKQSVQPSADPRPAAEQLEHEQDVLRAIRDTSFGTIEVVVHQSRIVQITRSEKLRFERADALTR